MEYLHVDRNVATRIISKFWYINEMFLGPEVEFDDKNYTYIDSKNQMRLDKDFENIWNDGKEIYGLPKRDNYQKYKYGEIVFSLPQHKFIVYLNEKAYNDSILKKKVIERFKLPSIATKFDKLENIDESS